MQSNNHQIADYPLLLNREFDARGLPCAPRREQGACARPPLSRARRATFEGGDMASVSRETGREDREWLKKNQYICLAQPGAYSTQPGTNYEQSEAHYEQAYAY